MRASRSLPPPAAKPTRMRIGLLGNVSCDHARSIGAMANVSAAATELVQLASDTKRRATIEFLRCRECRPALLLRREARAFHGLRPQRHVGRDHGGEFGRAVADRGDAAPLPPLEEGRVL